MKILVKISTGLTGLLKSTKGTLCLLILACATFAVAKTAIDGPSYAAIVGTIATVFMWTRSKANLAKINKEDHEIL